jgi:leucyl-tRNA synthetase
MDKTEVGVSDQDLIRAMHKAIQEVTSGIESFGFNAAIAKLYGFSAILAKSTAGYSAQHEAIMTLAQLMSPMTPHLSEHIWLHHGGDGLIANAPWPKFNPNMLVEDEVTLPIQINGKRRDEVVVSKDIQKEELEVLVLMNKAVIKALDGAKPKKLIIVPGRIINVVI